MKKQFALLLLAAALVVPQNGVLLWAEDAVEITDDNPVSSEQVLSESENFADGIASGSSAASLSEEAISSQEPSEDYEIESLAEAPVETADSSELVDSDVEPVLEVSVPIDEEHFPDDNFRAYIAENFDTDKDGVLSNDEIQEVYLINVSGMEIHSLAGIEIFQNLMFLNCSNNSLRLLELSSLPELEEVNCSSNELVSINVPDRIERLDAADNHLTSFDVTGKELYWGGTSFYRHYLKLEQNVYYIPGTFDLTELISYGFDISKASDWEGGILNGTILKASANRVTYRYNMGIDPYSYGEHYNTFSLVVKDYTLNQDHDGVWRVFCGDSFASDYTGIFYYEGGEFFVANGVLCSEANGLNLYNGKWYFLSNGQIQTQWNGFAEYDGHWFMIKNGMLDETANGLQYYDGGWFLFAAGKLQDQYSGLWENTFDEYVMGDKPGKWYFLSNGQVQEDASGVAMYDGSFFKIDNGRFDKDFNGIIEYDDHDFNVVNGQLDKNPIN